MKILLERAEEAGVSRKAVDPVQIHVTVAAMDRFHLSNAYRLSAMFGQNLADSASRKVRRTHVRDVIMAHLTGIPARARS